MKKHLPWLIAMLAVGMRADTGTPNLNSGPIIGSYGLAFPLPDVANVACSTGSRPNPPGRSSGRGVTLPAGTEISIRLLEKIDLDASVAGRQFRATVEGPVAMGVDVLIPRGADALVEAVKVERLTNLAGSDDIVLKVGRISVHDRYVDIVTGDVEPKSASTIPPESVLQFQLASDVTILAACLDETVTSEAESKPDSAAAVRPVAVLPALRPVTAPPAETGVNWKGALLQGFNFLAVEEGFRELTQNQTRHSHKPFFQGYADSVANLHGWADGDYFLTNYVGHPMQGAISGFIWIHNDRRYRTAEFGRNREYWRSRLRATAFSWVYSEQEEIGPFSEAMFGASQSFFPQQGFVDHVITPTIGLAWLLAEDMVDTWVVKPLEPHIRSPYLKMLLRGWANPSRSMANMMEGQVPWARETRGGVFAPGTRYGTVSQQTSVPARTSEYVPAAVAPFEVSILALTQTNSTNGGPCVGGGVDASLRIATSLQLTLEVAGCKMTGLETNLSGDSLTYMIGPRWTPAPTNRWSPYAQLLAGGQKISYEDFYPAVKAALVQTLDQEGKSLDYSDHALYTSDWGTNAFAFKAGAGVDLKLRSAIAVRVIGVDYLYSSLHHAEFQVTGGFVLRLGTW
jgi:hypothetical protein